MFDVLGVLVEGGAVDSVKSTATCEGGAGGGWGVLARYHAWRVAQPTVVLRTLRMNIALAMHREFHPCNGSTIH
jgi:hypothetical protein